MPPVELDTISRIPTEAVHNIKESLFEPVVTRSKSNRSFPLLEDLIEDVETPVAPTVTYEDITVPPTESSNELETIVGGIVDKIASFTLVQTTLKTIDFALDICEKFVTEYVPSTTKYVQGVRRYLRAVRHAGRRHARHSKRSLSNKKTRSLRHLPSRKSKAMREASLLGYFADIFKMNFFLNFLGFQLTFANDPFIVKQKSCSLDTDDEESTVYKLMKEYDSHDDADYIPSDSSDDSMEFQSDFSEDETTVDKLMKDYAEHDDQDYVPSEASEDSFEYNSDAELSQDAEQSQDAEESQESQEDCEESQDAEVSQDDCTQESDDDSQVEETTVGQLMKDTEDEQTEDDADYVPEEKSEDSCEYNSDEEAIKEITQDSEDDVEDAEESEEMSQEKEAEIVMVNEADIEN